MTILQHVMDEVRGSGQVNAQFKTIKLKIGRLKIEKWFNFMLDATSPEFYMVMFDINNKTKPIVNERGLTIAQVERLVADNFETLFY